MPLYGQQAAKKNGELQQRSVINRISLPPSTTIGTSDYQLVDRGDTRNFSQDFNVAAWAKTAIGTGSFTYAPSDTASESVKSDVTVINGRYFVTPNHNTVRTLVAGHTYVFSCYVEEVTGDVPDNWIYLIAQADVSYGSYALAGTPVAGNRYGVVATVIAGGIVHMRIGIGASVVSTATGSVTFSKIMLQDITDFDSFDYFDNWQAPWVAPRNHPPNCRFEIGATSGIIIEEPAAALRDYTRTNLLGAWLGTGDSFANGIGDWPDVLAITTKYFVNGAGYSGERIDGKITTKLAENLLKGNFDGVILQGGINNITAGHTLAQMQGFILAEINLIKAESITTDNIIFINISGIKGHVLWSEARQTVMDAYNAWLESYASFIGAQYVDIYNLLGDPADKRQLLALYDNGDSIHPNATGQALIAEAVRAKMAIIENNAVSYT